MKGIKANRQQKENKLSFRIKEITYYTDAGEF